MSLEKNCWSRALRNTTSQTITNEFFETLLKCNVKHNISETDDGKNFFGKIFTNLLISNDVKRYSRETST